MINTYFSKFSHDLNDIWFLFVLVVEIGAQSDSLLQGRKTNKILPKRNNKLIHNFLLFC